MQLVVLGTLALQVKQVERLKALLSQQGLPEIDDASAESMVWDLAYDGVVNLGCIHLHVGITQMGAETEPAVQRFMVEAMKLAGVHTSCPEHDKRRFWEKNEQVLKGQQAQSAQSDSSVPGKNPWTRLGTHFVQD